VIDSGRAECPENVVSEPHIPAPDEQAIPSAENLFKAALLPGTILASFFVAQAGTVAIEANLPGWTGAMGKWIFVALLGVWNCVLLTGMGVLAHDAVHRALSRNPFCNELVGGLLSALALLPFCANRQFHLTHHSYAHQPGLDPENEMHDHPFWYALSVGSVIALGVQYRNLLRGLLRIREPGYAARAAKDLLSLAVAASFYFVWVPALGLSLAYTVVPMLLALLPVFAWRALSDHYGVPPAASAAARREIFDTNPDRWEEDVAKRRREVSGWVVLTSPWLEWLWSHVNYHEVHHKYPWLSHAHLKAAFEATRDSQPYLIVEGYWRSLVYLSRSKYYGTRERTQAFLTTGG
jgi:fatty acid desaturase